MQRAYDQLIMDVALQNLHVVFCLDRAGLVGEDGPTHHGVFDLTYLRSVPNIMVLAPSNEAEMAEALHTALKAECPVAIRYPRGAGRGMALPEQPAIWEPGRSVVRREGDDVALLAVGRMVQVAEDAAAMLAEDGVSAGVIDMRWVKPLDVEALSQAARTHRLLVTMEENTAAGGFGGSVCETLADLDLRPALLRIAVPDCFVTHGATAQLLAEIGLNADAVRTAVLGRLIDVPSVSDAAVNTADGSRKAVDGSAPHRRPAR